MINVWDNQIKHNGTVIYRRTQHWTRETSVATSTIAKQQANKVKNWSIPWKDMLYGSGLQIYCRLLQSNIVAKISKILAHFRLNISDDEKKKPKRSNTQLLPSNHFSTYNISIQSLLYLKHLISGSFYLVKAKREFVQN